jgi:hypothetical protein
LKKTRIQVPRDLKKTHPSLERLENDASNLERLERLENDASKDSDRHVSAYPSGPH